MYKQFLIILSFILFPFTAFAHWVAKTDAIFLESNQWVAIMDFIFLGAKHMITWYDHILFLIWVIFLLHRFKDIVLFVSLFTIGHSITLLLGVIWDIHLNSYLIDAIIGLSVVYKGFDNLGWFRKIFGFQPNTKIAVLIFGLFHGFGLATVLQEYTISKEWLITNIISFNVGVEVWQIWALFIILILFTWLRSGKTFINTTFIINAWLMLAGFLLIFHQLTSYFLSIS